MNDTKNKVADGTVFEGILTFRDTKDNPLEVGFGENWVGFKSGTSSKYCELNEPAVRYLYNKLGAWLTWRNG